MSLFNNNSPIGKPQGVGDFAIRSTPISTVTMNSVMRLVYVWMTLGLAITAVLALYISNQIEIAMTTGAVSSIWLNQGVMIGAIIAELVVVLVLSFGLQRKWLSPTMAVVLFMVYAALNGITISWIIWFYGQAAVYKAFASTAGLFAVMSIYGYTTKSDLMGLGRYLMMALIGLLIALVINIFLRSTALDFVISIFGVLLFTALTAYDTQKIKRMAEDPANTSDGNMVLKVSIYGALHLYLDFINLFLYLLRLFGNSRR